MRIGPSNGGVVIAEDEDEEDERDGPLWALLGKMKYEPMRRLAACTMRRVRAKVVAVMKWLPCREEEPFLEVPKKEAEAMAERWLRFILLGGFFLLRWTMCMFWACLYRWNSWSLD